MGVRSDSMAISRGIEPTSLSCSMVFNGILAGIQRVLGGSSFLGTGMAVLDLPYHHWQGRPGPHQTGAPSIASWQSRHDLLCIKCCWQYPHPLMSLHTRRECQSMWKGGGCKAAFWVTPLNWPCPHVLDRLERGFAKPLAPPEEKYVQHHHLFTCFLALSALGGAARIWGRTDLTGF